MIFDERDLLDTAARTPAAGPPATLGESLSSSFVETFGNRTAAGDDLDIHDEFERLSDAVHERTGERLPNPWDIPQASSLQPRDWLRTYRDRQLADFDAKLRQMHDADPAVPYMSYADVLGAVAIRRKNRRIERAEVERREHGTAAAIASGIGAMGGAILDPPVLASMAFGAPVATGILRGALIDAGIGLASEAVVQGAVQLERQRFGEKPDLGEAASSLVAAGAGGFVLSGLIRAGVKGARALLHHADEARAAGHSLSPEAEDAAALLRRQADLESLSPYPDTPAGRDLHARRMDGALAAAREGRVPSEAVAEEAAPDALRRTVSGDLVEPGSPRASLPPLTADERATVETLAKMAEEPARFAGYLDTLRFPPKVEEPTLMQFLRSKGGLRSDPGGELANMGVTPRRYPGFISRKGLTLDDAALSAWERGYFPEASERPDIGQLLGLLDEEVNRGRPARTLEGQEAAQARDAAIEGARALEGLGIDLRRMRTPEVAARIRDLAREVDPTRVPPERRRGAAARAEADRVATSNDAAAELDAMRERELEKAFAGRENEHVWIETDAGQFQRMTVREMFEGFQRDADDLAALKICVGGGR